MDVFSFLLHGGSATTENAIPVRRWLFELVTHIFARWWCTVPLSCVNSQHLNSPPSLTAVASPHAIPTNTNEHCCLLKIQVELMILANSLASHSLAPVFRAPREKKLLESGTWRREGAILPSSKIPRAPPLFEVCVIITCSMVFNPLAGAALWGSGGNSGGTWDRFLNPGIRKT